MYVEWNESGVLTITSRTGESIRVREVVDIDKGNDNMTLKVEKVSKDEAFGLVDAMPIKTVKEGENESGCPFCNYHQEPCSLGCHD